MKPCSLPKATIEPVRLTPPITAPSSVAIMGTTGSSGAPDGRSLTDTRNSESATTAAAPPPAPLKIATIWGMAVIGTRRAPSTPMTDPTPPATSTIHQCSSIPAAVNRVQMTTSAMPPAPSRFPVRAVRGDERNLSARMKVIPDSR